MSIICKILLAVFGNPRRLHGLPTRRYQDFDLLSYSRL
jgi:hypothetical protein